MSHPKLETLPQLLKYIAGIGAAAYILLYVAVVLLRIHYPYELECMEGMAADHVTRILSGKPLYVAPTIDFAPSIYTPLYYYASAGLAALFGMSLMPLRLISFLASLGSMALLFAWVRRETKSPYAGLLAAGLFAATFHASGAWYDLAHVDSLFVFLLLAAFWVLRYHPNRTGFLLAALLLVVDFFVKQTTLLAALFFMAYAAKERKSGGLYFVAAFVLLTGLGVLLMNALSGGWFSVYVFELPAQHPLIKMQFLKFFPEDIFRPLPLVSLFVLLYLALRYLKGERREVWFYLLTGAGFIAAAAAPRMKDGHYISDLIPVHAFLALLFGLAFPALFAWGKELLGKMPSQDPERRQAAWLLPAFAYAAILIQFVALFYGPQNILPKAADREAGDRLIRQLSQIKGDIWVVHHGYLATLAGKRTFIMAQPIYDIQYSQNEPAKEMIAQEIERALAERRFEAIIEDEDSLAHMSRRPDYEGKPLAYAGPKEFWPTTAHLTRPTLIFTPKKLEEAVGESAVR